MRNGLDWSSQSPRIPLAVKLVFSVFVAWHLWVNLHFYGPMNYLWLCDIAVLTTAVSLWTENSLLLSMTAISFLGPAAIWIADIMSHLMSSHDWWGVSSYLGDPRLPLSLRCASLFHVWMPLLLFYSLYRLGYDRRAFWAQSIVTIIVLILSRVISDPPPAHSLHDVINVNCVYGRSDVRQTALPDWLYVCKLILKGWICLYIPLHLILRWAFKRRPMGVVSWEPETPVMVAAAVQQT